MLFWTACKQQIHCQGGHTNQQTHRRITSLSHTSCRKQHGGLHILVASTEQLKMWFPQFTGVHVSSWLGCDAQLRMVLIKSCSFGFHTVKSTAYQHCPPYGGVLHRCTNRTINAGQPPMFPLNANTSTGPAAQKESLFCIFSPHPTDRNVWEASSSGWQGPLDCCWPPVPVEQELSQGPQTDAKWVTGVQKDDWQHNRSNQEWLWTFSRVRSQSMSKIYDWHLTANSQSGTWMLIMLTSQQLKRKHFIPTKNSSRAESRLNL